MGMSYSGNDYAADTLSITLETLEEALECSETDEEQEAIICAMESVNEAREIVLKREGPTPTQQLVEALQNRSE